MVCNLVRCGGAGFVVARGRFVEGRVLDLELLTTKAKSCQNGFTDAHISQQGARAEKDVESDNVGCYGVRSVDAHMLKDPRGHRRREADEAGRAVLQRRARALWRSVASGAEEAAAVAVLECEVAEGGAAVRADGRGGDGHVDADAAQGRPGHGRPWIRCSAGVQAFAGRQVAGTSEGEAEAEDGDTCPVLVPAVDSRQASVDEFAADGEDEGVTCAKTLAATDEW